jgi:acyl-CoA synthetase (AMP-forming)/AMP-acid ligase II
MELPELDYRATMAGAIRHAAEVFADREFVVTSTRRMTYAMAEASSRRIGKELLALGVGKGTRVGIMFGYGSEWIVAWLAITRIGAVCMPFSTAYMPAELRKALRFSDVDTFLIPSTLVGRDQEAFVEEAVPGLAQNDGTPLRIAELPYLRRVLVSGGVRSTWGHDISLDFENTSTERSETISESLFEAVEAEVTPADLFMAVFTSGTTSGPKGVIHTHGNFLRHGENLAAFQAITGDERIFCGSPFFWIGGVGVTLNYALARGCTLVCIDRFELNAALDIMEVEQVTMLSMFSQLSQRLRQRIANEQRDVSRIPVFATSSSATSTTDPGLRHKSLGMTETVGPHTAAGPEVTRVLPEEMRGSFGLPVPYVNHRIADPVTNATLADGEVGEVCVRGYSLMSGLYKQERHETFDDDGWYHTGDEGFLLDGYLYFLGRFKEMIKTQGANVAPQEVEVVLETFPEITWAVVFGLPDVGFNEIVGAVLVTPRGMVIDVNEILERLAKEISSYKVPAKVLVLTEDELPMLQSGKPDRVVLRKRLIEM